MHGCSTVTGKVMLLELIMFNFSTSFIHSATLLEQHDDVTGALVIVINALYDEKMHADVSNATSRS